MEKIVQNEPKIILHLYSHATHNNVLVSDGSHIRRWSLKIIIL